MIRLLGVLLLASVMAAASYVYNVKHEAERLTRRSTELSREMEREREMIGILRAEWAHLNQPQRLQSLAERHLRDMRPQNVAALALPHEIPQRPMDLGLFIASIEREGGIRLAPLPAPVPRAQPVRPAVQTARAPSPTPERVQRAQTPPPRPAPTVAQARPATPPPPARAQAPAPTPGGPMSLLPQSFGQR